MPHHIKLTLNIFIQNETPKYSLQLAPNDSGIYCWYLYNRSDNILVHTYQESLNKILDIIQTEFHYPVNITNNDKQIISVIAIFDQPTPIYPHIRIAPILIHRHAIDIGTVRVSPQHIHFTPTSYTHNQLAESPLPEYDISPIASINAQDAAIYLCTRIPIDHIIQRHITQFPGQISTQPEILQHYSEWLTHAPCATTILVNKKGCNEMHFMLPHIMAPQNTIYHHIKIDDRQHNTPFIIDPNAKYNDIAEPLSRAIYQAYIEKPEIDNLSQHEKIAITRIFQQHGAQIAQNVYTTAMRHRAARLQCVIFDFPRIPQS